MSSFDNRAALVQVMAWRRAGDEPLHAPMVAQFTGSYMRQWGRWVKIEQQEVEIKQQEELIYSQDCFPIAN